MGKFWRTPDFKDLNKVWRDKLKQTDFEDIEDEKGNLKQYDRRTIAFDNREVIFDFFTKLGSYLANTPELPLIHRKILELYCEGKHIKGKNGIIEMVGLSDSGIRKIIRKYKILLK